MINIIIPTIPGNEKELEECIQSIIKNTIEEYKLIIVKNYKTGFAKAINMALKDADDDVVLLNDDTVVSKNWLREFMSVKYRGDIICVCGYLQKTHIPFWAVYIKKIVIDKIGLLDEQFEIGEYEDVDYCIRALENKFLIAETNNTNVFHKISSTIRFLNYNDNMKKIKNKEKFMSKYKDTVWIKHFQEEEIKKW